MTFKVFSEVRYNVKASFLYLKLFLSVTFLAAVLLQTKVTADSDWTAIAEMAVT